MAQDEEFIDGNAVFRHAKKMYSEKEYRQRYQRRDFFVEHEAQRRAFTDTHKFLNVRAGNRSGKTTYVAVEASYQLTGTAKPKRLQGFVHPVSKIDRGPFAFRCWMIGPTSVVVRDVLQAQILGGVTQDTLGTGWLPLSSLRHQITMSRGIANLADKVMITRDDGSLADLSFKTHEMDAAAFQGDAVDLVILDEDPGRKGEFIWPELVARIIGTGGRIIHTATPRAGLSPVRKFFKEAGHPERGEVRMSIYDNTYLSPEDIATAESSYSERERATRLFGDDMPGAGAVFNVSEEQYLHSLRPEDVPSYWLWINGIDFSHFGMSSQAHPWAFVSCCIDPATGTLYVMHSLRIKQQLAPVHVSRAKDWGAWDAICAYGADGAQATASGDTFAGIYRKEGLPLRMTHATLKDGSVSLEATIYQMEGALASGQLKIARHLMELRGEIRELAYDDNNKIIAEDDDIVSALRYAWMDRRYAKHLPNSEEGRRQKGQVIMAKGIDDWDIWDPSKPAGSGYGSDFNPYHGASRDEDPWNP
jgi:phage terminase large subunit-like protein